MTRFHAPPGPRRHSAPRGPKKSGKKSVVHYYDQRIRRTVCKAGPSRVTRKLSEVTCQKCNDIIDAATADIPGLRIALENGGVMPNRETILERKKKLERETQ